MSHVQDELDDYLASIKLVLTNFVYKLVKEEYQELYQEHQKMLVKMTRLEKDIKELQKKQVIWEK